MTNELSLVPMTLSEAMQYVEAEGNHHYNLECNLPADKLALVEAINKVDLNKEDTELVSKMMGFALSSLDYPFHEGDSERFEPPHQVGEQMATGHPDYNDINRGFQHMYSWTTHNYDKEINDLLQRNNHEALIGLSVMYRRELYKQSINRLTLAQGIVEMDPTDEGLIQSAETVIRPEDLEFFNFNDLIEFNEYVQRFKDFEKHQDIRDIYQIFAAEAYTAAVAKYGEETLKKQGITLDTEINNASNGMFFYVMISRAISRNILPNNGIDFKNKTLAKLGIKDEVIVDEKPMDTFPLIEVPDTIDLQYMSRPRILSNEEKILVKTNLKLHMSNVNLWFQR